MNKYEELIAIIKEEYDKNCELTADLVETLVYKQIVDEEVIDAIVTGDADEEVISELVCVVCTYQDFMSGLDMDNMENHEFKNSDEN